VPGPDAGSIRYNVKPIRTAQWMWRRQRESVVIQGPN